MRETLSLACLLTLSLPWAALSASQDVTPLEQRLSAEEMHATGLDTLSAAQLALLNQLLARQSVAAAVPTVPDNSDAAHSAATPPGTHAARAEGADAVAAAEDRPAKGWNASANPVESATGEITTRLVGSVQSWAPGTVFELENGQSWQVLKGEVTLPQALQAPTILLVPGFAGRWFLQVDERYPKARVERIR